MLVCFLICLDLNHQMMMMIIIISSLCTIQGVYKSGYQFPQQQQAYEFVGWAEEE